MEEKNLICIGCPMGCPLTVKMEHGEVVSVTGNTCKRGDIYARKEVTNPTRIVTSTVRVTGGSEAMVSVKTKEGFDLILKTKNTYDEKTHTQYSFSIYELYNESKLLQQELMDFQTHLYELGEIEAYLHTIGFTKVIVYASYEKAIAKNNQTEMFLYECSF